MAIRKEVISHLAAIWLFGIAAGMLTWSLNGAAWIILSVHLPVVLLLTVYLLWFFRDPERNTHEPDSIIVSAADGKVTGIMRLTASDFRRICTGSGLTETAMAGMKEFTGHSVVRISVFLSLTDVHVNRSPMAGTSEFLGYFPGKHLLTIREKSSEVNQHNAIRIYNHHTGCLIFQIVGPVARRVVYWPDKSRPVPIRRGERIGMMKFGSRLDLYLPEPHIRVLVKPGDVVRAGLSPVAEIKHSPL